MIRVTKACTVELENVYFENTGAGFAMETGSSVIGVSAENCEFVNSNTTSTNYSRGMLLYGSTSSSAKAYSIKNCKFKTNGINNGAALQVQGGGTSCAIEIDNCEMINNGTTTSAYALNFGTNLDGNVTVTNSTISAPNGACAVYFNYSIKSTANITFGEGNTVTGQMRFGNASNPSYVINVTGGCFGYTVDEEETVPFVPASTADTAVPISNLLNLTGGYFKADVSDVTASGYDCVANTKEIAEDNYNEDYYSDGYTYTVVKNTLSSNFYVKTDDGKEYFDSFLEALKSDLTGTVYFAEDYTLTSEDIEYINSKGRTVSNYGGVTLNYDGTLKELLTELTAGTINVSLLTYKYDADTTHTIKSAKIIGGVLTSGTLSDMRYDDGAVFNYYTDDILTGSYVYYYSAGSFSIIDIENTTYSPTAEVDGKFYVSALSYAVEASISLNSYDGKVHTATLLKNTSADISVNDANASFVLDLNGCTMGYLYITYHISSSGSSYANGANVTVKNGTIMESSDSFAVFTNGTLTGVTLTMENVNIEHTDGIAVYLASGGTYSFTDCTVSGQTGIVARSGDISITDTTITATGDYNEYDATYSGGAQNTGDALALIASDYPGGAPSIVKFSGNLMTSENGCAVVCRRYSTVEEGSDNDIQNKQFITDGTYSDDVADYSADYVADNYYTEKNEDGTYTVYRSATTVYDNAGTATYLVTLNDLYSNLDKADAIDHTKNEVYEVVLSDIDETDTTAMTALDTIESGLDEGYSLITEDVSVKKYVSGKEVDFDYNEVLTMLGAPQEVTIELPVKPADNSVKVYHLVGNSPTTELSDVEVDGKNVTFSLSSFSPVAVAYDGTELVADDLASNVYLQLDDGDDEDDGVYTLKLYGADDKYIYRFSAAQLKFVLADTDSEGNTCDITKIGALDIEPISGINVAYEGNGVYAFYADTSKYPNCLTSDCITLGTVTISGTGKYSLGLDTTNYTNQAHGADTSTLSNGVDNNIVADFVYDANALGTGETGKLYLDSTIPAEGTLSLAPCKLTVNVMFPNTVAEADADYTSMTVTINGTDADETPVELGYDNQGAQKTVTIENVDSTKNLDGYYGYTFTTDVYQNYTYTLTFEGDGYRTYRTSITPTAEDASVTVWNNVMDDEATIVTVNDDNAKKADVTFLAGDIVNKGVIDLYDLSAVVSYFGKTGLTAADTNYIQYDLNRDSKIDSKDIAMVLVSWGK